MHDADSSSARGQVTFDEEVQNAPSGPGDEVCQESIELRSTNATNESVFLRSSSTREQIRHQKLTEMTAFGAVLWVFFLLGWNDGTAGPMLPAIQRYYHVGRR